MAGERDRNPHNSEIITEFLFLDTHLVTSLLVFARNSLGRTLYSYRL